MITDVENAIQAWLSAATGIPSARVYWGEQNAPRGSGPRITAQWLSDTPDGTGWVDIADTVNPTAGNEITHTARNTFTGRLSIQCFAGTDSTALLATGNQSPLALLRRARSKLNLPTIAEALNTANVSVNVTGVTSVPPPGVIGARIEPRAVMEAIVYYTDEESETGTFIQFVELGQDDDPPIVLPP